MAFDDELLILDNAKVHGLTLENIIQAFTTYDPELYVPFTLLTYQIEWSLVGDSPLLYHITNLVIHLLSTFFVFKILRRFFSNPVSIIGALLFSLHPIQVEAVAWVSGRKDLLASMFFLASTYTYLLWKDSGKCGRCSITLFLLGLLSKISIFPLPFCLLLLDYLKGERITKRRITEKWLYFLLAGVFLLIAFSGKQVQASADIVSLVLTAFISIPLTIFHIVFPLFLTIFYPFIESVHLLHPRVLIGILIVSILAGTACYFRNRVRVITFSILWFILLLTPSLLNVQKGGELGIPDVYLTSDRYAYIAILGPVVLIAFLLKRIRWDWTIIPLVVLALLTIRQTQTWQSSSTLFQRVIEVKQPAYIAYLNLAGYAAHAEDYNKAEKLYEEALQIRKSSKILYNLIQLKGLLGKKSEARALYEEYVKMRPNDSKGRLFLNKFIL